MGLPRGEKDVCGGLSVGYADGIKDVFPTFKAIAMPRRIAFLIFPDFQLLDAAGPIAAFEIAGRIRPGAYELKVIAVRPGRGAQQLAAHSSSRRACRAPRASIP